MNSEIPRIKIINYYECNIDSIWISIIIIIIMIFFILFLKIVLYSEIYNIYHICHPIPFFFGEPQSCKQMINSLKIEHLKEISDREKAYEFWLEGERLKRKRQQELIDQQRDHENQHTIDITNTINNNNQQITDLKAASDGDCGGIGEDFRNQYNNVKNFYNSSTPYLQFIFYTIPSYILAMYQKIILIINNSIGKIKNILYILFKEYLYPKLYRIIHV